LTSPVAIAARHAKQARALLLLRQLPWLILLLMLGVTGFVWDHERQVTGRVLRYQFDSALRETVSRIEQRVQGYEQMLRGVQSLFATTAWPNRAAMHDYVETLQLDANFSGVQVIGLVEWVPQQSKATHLAAMRAAGFADYAIEPDGLREVYAPIIQREPYAGRAHLGGDVWDDPVRRLAMERARDSGMAAISGKVRLKVDASGVALPGFIMYLPIYAPGLPHDSLQQRRTHLLGWVYAAFHMNEFMASLYGNQSPGLAVAVYDDTDVSAASLLYQSDGGAALLEPSSAESIQSKEYMVVAGRNWTLSLRTQEAFESRYVRSMATGIALAGITLSVLLAMLAWQLIHGRNRALRLAAAMTEELRHMAQHDPLTGLPNRALFNDRLGQELARAKRQQGRFAMVFLDLDHFKPINDNYGHLVGDHILKEVAQRLQKCVRAADTVGRIGGDEFVVLLAQLSDEDTAQDLAEKLRLALKPAFLLNARELHLSCSIGVALYPQHGTEAIALTKSADEAMYRAKEEGRDCVRVSD
jgi:diguanylate cyclase (GGDEF)-like protein